MIENCSNEDYQFLKYVFSLVKRDEKQLDTVKDLLKHHKIDNKINEYLNLHKKKSYKILDNFKNNESENLKKLINESIERSY